jgi:hypothetical protein
MIDAPWENIVLNELWPGPTHPIRLRGKFRGRELCAVEVPDLQISWERAPDQDYEAFSRSVADAILEMRGQPPLDATERRGGSAEAARYLASYRRTARHGAA